MFDVNKIDNYLHLDNEIIFEILKISTRYFKDLKNDMKNTKEKKYFLSYADYLKSIDNAYEMLEEKDEWMEIVYQIFSSIKFELEQNNLRIGLGLYNGWCDLAYSINSLSQKMNAFNKFNKSFNNIVIENIYKWNELVRNNIFDIKASYYDLISGLSGMCQFLISCDKSQDIRNLLEEICITFWELICGTHHYKGGAVPNWHISKSNQVRDDLKILYPEGNFNFGSAHGIISILPAVSKIIEKYGQIEYSEKLLEKIENIYYDYSQKGTEGFLIWPEQANLDEFLNKNPKRSERQSWCYGSVGISSLIYRSAVIRNDNNVSNDMYSNLIKIASLNERNYGLESPIICHGYAGVLIAFLSIYTEKKNKLLYQRIVSLIRLILESYHPESLYGFKDTTYEKLKDGSFRRKKVDNNSFLEGSTGIVLTLLSAINKNTNIASRLLIR